MIILSIKYKTEPGQHLSVSFDNPQPSHVNNDTIKAMTLVSGDEWVWELVLDDEKHPQQYKYIVQQDEIVVRREWGKPHSLHPAKSKNRKFRDLWQDQPQDRSLYTSAFTDVFFKHNKGSVLPEAETTYSLNVDCPYIREGQLLKMISTSSNHAGQYDTLELVSLENAVWQASFGSALEEKFRNYRLAIFDPSSGIETHTDEYGERKLLGRDPRTDMICQHISYEYKNFSWKGAGVSIPVFALRSEESYGIGEFSDLKKLADWASATGQKVIQILPVNDTTSSYGWGDSYPYNTISVYALNPAYFAPEGFPLKNKSQLMKFREEALILNRLEETDYEKVRLLKEEYLQLLFKERGKKTMETKEYLAFHKKNEYWLFPYSCFCYLRDRYQTTSYALWEDFGAFDEKKLHELIETDEEARSKTRYFCFVQYLLHLQLSEVKEYAHSKGVVLKGDIPIGVNHNSVETWVEPHLFHLNMQTGAPPDAFAVDGQNWGFPTYNWREMAKDDYAWWKRRFEKMSDYFDVYRIDHILGFFRIWEIPSDASSGILGHFEPALPFSQDEMADFGFRFERSKMTRPYINYSYLPDLFGNYTHELINTYFLGLEEDGLFELKDEYSTQKKIGSLLNNYSDEKQNVIRQGLYKLCQEVLFIEDPIEKDKFHPRIDARLSYIYASLADEQKSAFDRLYEEFYYHRHSEFWELEALKKLPPILYATGMLPCGEDLGMIPESTPKVMRALQILSLEVERWSKDGSAFSNLNTLPYLSVCTTSTHDMSPIREWWNENPSVTAAYYKEILGHDGDPPVDCSPELCTEILRNHLNSSSMLAIIPIQDIFSIDGTIRKKGGASERINVPADPAHNWKYRMHITLEELLQAYDFNIRLSRLIKTSLR